MNREELIDLRKQVQRLIEDGRAFPADVLSAQIVLVFEQAHTPTEVHEKPVDTSPEPVKNGGDSLHVTPTTDAVRERIHAREGCGFWGLEGFNAWLAARDARKRAEWEAEQGEVEYGWAGGKHATVFYDTQEEAEEFMGAPKKFARRKAGEWVPVNEDETTDREVGNPGPKETP